jgi:membrane-associated protease RseP (regulator of RpoE activity)
MSSYYQRFRQEMAAGGAVDEIENPQATRSGKLVGVVIVALLVFLGIRNPWTLVFVIGLLISVFLHEVGHFSTARLTGMKATQFFMGFGPRIWSRTRGETEYGVRALPLGAFVRIIGMNNLDEVDPADEPRAYRSKSYPRRLLVITAGSLMHMLIAFTLFFGVYTISGREQNTGQSVIRGLDIAVGPAAKAGLKDGDKLISIGGVRVTDYNSVVAAIKSHKVGDSVTVAYQRNDIPSSVSVVLVAHPGDATRPYLGIYADDWGWKKLSIVSASTQSVADMGRTLVDSVKGVAVALNPVNSVKHLANPKADNSTRPTTVVGASQVGGTIGRSEGLKGILTLLASINVFVGVFNMFPLLPFDGGHAAIATYERIRSRKGKRYKADIEKMVPVATVVVGLLVLLMVTGLYLDITQPLG